VEYVIDELNTIASAKAGTTDTSRITLSHFCRWTLPAQEPSFIWLYDILLGILEADPSLFKEIYRKFDIPPLTYSDLEALVLRLIQTSSFQDIDIIVDGLDECGEESVWHMSRTLIKLWLRKENVPRIRILLTASSMDIFPDPLKSKGRELILDIYPQFRNPQIMAFIENQLTASPNKHSYSNQFSIEIRHKLYSNASLPPEVDQLSEQGKLFESSMKESRGNFNWILAAIDAVEGEPSLSCMKERLAKLPTSLEGLYDICLRRIPLQDRDFVAKILHFTRCSFRPLETKALAFALAIRDSHKTTSEVWDDQIIDLSASIRPFSGDLLVFENGYVGFAHRSLSTYLDDTAGRKSEQVASTHPLIPLDAGKTHYEMAVSCIQCLMLDDDLETELDQFQTSRIPFVQYADEYWYKHASAARVDNSQLSTLVLSFIESSKIQGWLQRIGDAQPRLLLPEYTFRYHLLASLDLLELLPAKIGQWLYVDRLDALKRIPLHYALANNASRSLECLKRQVPGSEAVDTFKWTCLHFAIYSGDIALVRRYNKQEASAPSLLCIAIERRNWDIFELLLERLDSAVQSDDDSWTEWKDHLGQGLIHQAVISRNISVVEQLCNRNARLGLTNNDGMTALHLAAKLAEKPIVEYLLSQDSWGDEDILDTSDTNGDTALHLATMSGDVDIIRLLAEHGASPNRYNNVKQLPLHLAAMYGYEKVLNFLLAIGSPVNGDEFSTSPLHLAAAWGWSAVAKRLARAGANIDSRDSKRRTPLYLAAYNGSKNMVELLYSYGASATVSDADGMTPLHAAALQGWEPVVSLLLSERADVNAIESKRGQTPLHCAAISKNPSDEIVSLLLDAGADMEKPDKDGKTPLDAAKDSGNTLIAEFLWKAQSKYHSGMGTSSSSLESRISVKSVGSFSSATRMDLLWQAEEREQRNRQNVYDELL
jgi:ankyrin repeat protein